MGPRRMPRVNFTGSIGIMTDLEDIGPCIGDVAAVPINSADFQFGSTFFMCFLVSFSFQLTETSKLNV